MSEQSPEYLPAAQYLPPEEVLGEMADAGAKRATSLSTLQVLVLSMLAGAFITVGALFATLISTDVDSSGLETLLEGFGFSAGFFLVVLTGAVLFTEINVEMPATLLGGDPAQLAGQVARLWVLAAVGNFLGAYFTGWAIAQVEDYSPAVHQHLGDIVEAKMRFQDVGGIDGWSRAVLSGMIANWLVGIAAFLAVMGRTIIGKYIPILLAVSIFVAGGFLHSPANMSFFSLAEHTGAGPGWGDAFAWSIAPAALGNVLGGVFLVALPLWFAMTRRRSAASPDQV